MGNFRVMAGMAILAAVGHAQAALTFHGVPLSCVDRASRQYNVPAQDLFALMENEGAAPGVAVHDNNGTTDLGPMQVNTCHLPFLSNYGFSYDTLKNDACANVLAGAWVYARCLEQMGGNQVLAAACYNAGPNDLVAAYQDGYVQRFVNHLGAGVTLGQLQGRPHKPGLELVVEDQ